jgi:hypothetical protein
MLAGVSAENPTAAELLAEVNKAILDLLTKRVHSYSLAGVQYTYSDLDQLRKLRSELASEVANGTPGVELGTTGRRRLILADISGRPQ